MKLTCDIVPIFSQHVAPPSCPQVNPGQAVQRSPSPRLWHETECYAVALSVQHSKYMLLVDLLSVMVYAA